MLDSSISGLLQGVSGRIDALAQARRLYSDRLAPDFNALDFLRVDEIGLSRLIAWLLDPSETHAQGTAFLAAYIATFAPEWTHFPLDGVRVQLEAPCSAGGRLDVLVSGPDWRIAVENKPFAGDQNLQLTRYLATIDAVRHGKLIYLAGLEGQGPSEDSISAALKEERLETGQLVLSSYSALRPWLDLCRGACKAERIRSFIDDIQRHILHQFEGYRDMTEKTAVIDAVMSDRKSLEAANLIAASWPGAQKALLEDFHEHFAILAKTNGWHTESGLDASSDSKVDLHNPALPHITFTLNFERSAYRGFCWGVAVVAEDAGQSERLCKAITASDFGQGDGQNSWWPWWRYASANDADLPVPEDWTGSEGWIALRERTLAPQVIALATRMFAVLKAA